MLISGPPELPGLIGDVGLDEVARSRRCRAALALTMPAVTVLSRPNGEPIAITHSPTLSRLTSPIAPPAGRVASILTSGDVGALVGADDLRLELALVGQRDDDLVGAVDDVRVGHDVAVGAEDEARADAALLRLVVRVAAAARRAGAGPAGSAAGCRSGGRTPRCSGRPPAAAAPLRARSVVRMLTTDGPTRSASSLKSGSCRGTTAALAARRARPRGAAQRAAGQQRRADGGAGCTYGMAGGSRSMAHWRSGARRAQSLSAPALERVGEGLQRRGRHVAHHGDPVVAVAHAQRRGGADRLAAAAAAGARSNGSMNTETCVSPSEKTACSTCSVGRRVAVSSSGRLTQPTSGSRAPCAPSSSLRPRAGSAAAAAATTR